MNLKRKLRFYRYHLKRTLRGDSFWTLVIWLVFLSLFFLIFAFRGLIATLFIKPVGIANPVGTQTTESTKMPNGEN